MAGVVVTTTAVVAMTPEAMEAAVEAEVAWAEVTVVASINLVALRTMDHIMTLNRAILTPRTSGPGRECHHGVCGRLLEANWHYEDEQDRTAHD